MKRYPRYRDSGIEWIGDVPVHWKMKPLKHIADIVLGKMLTNDDKGGYFKRPYLRAQNVEWERVNTDDIKEMWFSEQEMKDYRLRRNDILVSEGGEVGRSALWKDELPECYIQNSVHKVMISNGGSPAYCLFHFEAYGKQGYFDAIVNRVSIAHLTREKLKDVRFLSPPSDEQQSISSYLDLKTRRIDELIEKKRRIIELLKEERVAVINSAVTKGLDPKAKMKGSDIEWLGEMPAHWEVRRLKHISPRQSVGLVINPSTYVDENGDVPFFFGSDISEGHISTEGVRKITKKSNDKIPQSKLYAGDLVTVRVGAPGISAVVPPELDESNCASMMIVRRSPDFNSHWLCYAMNSSIGAAQVEIVQYGAAQKQFNISHAVEFTYPVPPLKEQAEIVDFLNEKTNAIMALISKEETLIEHLQEYRTALISEVVTGKIDVRDFA